MKKKTNRQVQMERVSHRAAVERLRKAYRKLATYDATEAAEQAGEIAKKEVEK